MNKVAKSVDKEFGEKAYIKWNFTKFLIARDGTLVERFEPTAKMSKVEEAVAAQL
jgi:glutathione peroxidase